MYLGLMRPFYVFLKLVENRTQLSALDQNSYLVKPWLLTYATFSISEPVQDIDPIIHASSIGDLNNIIRLTKAEYNINIKSKTRSFTPLHLIV